MIKPKVFCIGLHKTGTTSLKVALEGERYRVATYFGIDNPNIQTEALAEALEQVSRYDAFQDDPWYLLYKELDQKYPGSKFVLTTRDSEQWFTSCLKHFGTTSNYVREWFYGQGQGAPKGNKKHWISRKEEHEADIRTYFINRGSDFLEIDICQGQGWELLGPFLGLNKTSGIFPRVNTAHSRTHEFLFNQYSNSDGFMRLFYRIKMKINRSLNQ